MSTFPKYIARLNADGSVELENPDGEIEWSSDEDDSFRLNFGDSVSEGDMDAVVDWMELEGLLDDSFDEIEIEIA